MNITVATLAPISTGAWNSMKLVALKAGNFFEEEFGTHIRALMAEDMYIGFEGDTGFFSLVKNKSHSEIDIELNAKHHVFAIVLMLAMLEIEPGSISSNLLDRTSHEFHVANDFFQSQIMPWMS